VVPPATEVPLVPVEPPVQAGLHVTKLVPPVPPFPVAPLVPENTFVASAVRENPVMKVPAAGLIPRFPVTADVGTVELPLLARMPKLPAAPRFTGNVELPSTSVTPLSDETRASCETPLPESPQALANESSRKLAPAIRG